jgi:hypothetical protein
MAHNTLSEDVRAVVDNLTHGAIGLLTWHIVTAHLADLSFTARLSEVMLCGLLASAIDLDHFAAARSFRIQVQQTLAKKLNTNLYGSVDLHRLAVSGLVQGPVAVEPRKFWNWINFSSC